MVNSIKDLKKGQTDDVFLFCRTYDTNMSRNGKDFQRVNVLDLNSNEYSILLFDNLMDFDNSIIIRATIKAEEFNGTMSYIMNKYQLTNDKSALDFLPKSTIDVKETWAELMKYIALLPDDLKTLVCETIKLNKKKYVSNPLDITGAYATVSGLLEATLKLTQISYQIGVELKLNLDLIVSSAVLYYVGRIKKIKSDFSYTPADVLYHNGFLSAMELERSLSLLDRENKQSLNPETVNLIIHILLAQDRGIECCIPEARVLKGVNSIILEVRGMKENLNKAKEGSILNSTNTYAKRIYKPYFDNSKGEKEVEEEKA